ncbi:cytochrome c oxidase assembly protein [Roseinatronobacter alkalisoli]|uniref:Cytochrome c oxidase assembly protein CtaG n=1 Tax=Roseinatronobacter alkalisoli TaxID=3028235 RepID=A0ABT5T9K6_9RHOB|nr:cytochrome c oxidase assembly protein [Roseinatronobacter sp. HJB301]MDD7971804.1 cytochrome c oxidase assembly protein [Roseinatronobacter sp. HJB301]
MITFWNRMTGIQKTTVQTVGVVLFMGAMGWAAVPLYDLFCRVTGYGGTTNTATASTGVVLDQTMRVRFDASVARNFPWQFKPVDRVAEIRIGEVGLAFYEAYNPTDKPIAGAASYNVSPYEAGRYFTKIDCFCFELQVLQPGESVLMPVTYFVDPDILDDRDAHGTHTITLSYTFHATDIPADYVTPEPAMTN